MAQSLHELSGTTLAPLLGRRLRVGDVLAFPSFQGARVVAGAEGLSRLLARVNVMQVPTAVFARRDELILATSAAFDDLREPPTSLLEALAERGTAALAAHARTLAKLGSEAVTWADQRSLPLLELAPGARLNRLLTELLETLVAAQSTQLRRAGTVRDELVDVVLSGGGLGRLTASIAGLTGGGAVIVDADRATLAASGDIERPRAEQIAATWLDEDWTAPAGTDDGWIVWPIMASGARLACLVARPARPDEPVALAVVQTGARTAAFAILHQLEERAAVARLTEQFVRDLLVGRLDHGAARRRATAVGWDPDTPYRLLLTDQGDGSGTALQDRMRRRGRALVVDYEGRCLALLPAAAVTADDLASAVGRRCFGLSARHENISELSRAHAEAREALRCAQLFGGPREFDPLSPLRMLANVPEEERRAFDRDVLAPLDRVDAEHREALMATLELLVETGLVVAETARRGGWHYNTVRYRVARLTELLGPFMDDGARLEAIAVALLLRRTVTRAPPPPRRSPPRPRRAHARRAAPSAAAGPSPPTAPRPAGPRARAG